MEVKSFSPGVPEDALLRLAAGAEHLSEHPLGKAVVRGYKKTSPSPLPAAEDSCMIPGRGVSANIEGHAVLAGNAALLAEHGISMTVPAEAEEQLRQGCTAIYIAADGAFAGYIALADTLRTESAGMIAQLSALGVQPVLLTGDHENAANTVAAKLGISSVRSGCLPEDKLTAISEYHAQEKDDPKSCKIYTIISVVGGVLAAVCALLLFL